MSIALFPHNRKAYQNAAVMLEQQGKAAVVHPTGTGKSFIAFQLAEDHADARICWLSPSEYIFRSQKENYLKAGGSEEKLRNVTFLTYAWLIWNEDRMAGLRPDYIILDEFHRCGAEEWGKYVERLIRMYPAAKVLGLSATNIRFLDNQRDMADELFDGKVASRMSLGEAIARGILPAPTYVTALYSYGGELQKMQRQVEHLKNPVLQKKCESILEKLRRSLENADALDRIFQKFMKPSGKYLVFCAGKEHMDEMTELAETWFGRVDEKPHIYHAYYDNSESREQFREFCGDDTRHLKLLYCIDMLNEGIHVADVDGVVLLRPTVSPILYLQQVGRALSSARSEQPVIFDLVNNFDGLYSVDSLKEQLEEAFCTLPDSVKGKWRERFQIFDEVRDCQALFEQLQRNLSTSWEIYYQEAERYYLAKHDLKVPKSYITDTGLALGNWILTQRQVRRGSLQGNLTEEKIARLDRLGMLWGDVNETKWFEGYQRLLDYKQVHGHVNVTSRYTDEDGFPLGRWLSNQRLQYGRMAEERRRLLEEAGVVWNVPEAEWNQYYAAAKTFYEEKGHLRVPNDYVTADGLTLGAWIGIKRCGRARLSEEKIAALEEIGMVWESYSQDRWNINYEIARNYYREHGHLNVPKDYETEGIKLGRWIGRMRERRQPGADKPLAEKQIKALDEIGMIWESSWDIRFNAAKKYYESHGDLKMAQTYVTENRIWLGKWLSEQKKKHGQTGRKGLTQSQVQKLESIGMRWE